MEYETPSGMYLRLWAKKWKARAHPSTANAEGASLPNPPEALRPASPETSEAIARISNTAVGLISDTLGRME